MNAVRYAKEQLSEAFNLFNVCADGMDDGQYNFQPPGTCNTPAQSHVHAMSSMDFFLNAMLRSGQMRWPQLAGQHGLPANPMEIWRYQGNVPYEPMKEYARAVQQDVLDYVGALKDDDLERIVKTQFFGEKSVAWILMLAVDHTMGHGGDIAAVKGMQGLKGLPF